MFGVSKKSQEPTTYFALAFFTCMVAFVILLIGMFTPNWSQVTEEVGTSLTTTVYDKGLIVSCFASQGCSGITEFSKLSGIFLASFILGIIAIVCGFFVIQIFCAGLFIRSCKETNLGVPIAALTIFEGALLMLVLVLFEISVSLDTLPGNIHRNDTFGFSRGLIIGAIVLYFVAALFMVGEYVRRTSGPNEPPNSSKDTKHRSHHHRSNRDEHRNRGTERGQQMVPLPPPYTRGNPVNNPYNERQYYSAANGMRSCKLPGCQMCSFVTSSPTFWGPAGIFNISDRLTCQDSHVVYAIICIKDDKVFIGHSQRKLADTFKEHLANIKTMRANDPVAFHFTHRGHSILDLQVSALTRINCDVTTRARLEKALSYDMDRPHNSYYGINDNFEFL